MKFKNNQILYIIIAISLIVATYFYTKSTISTDPTKPNFINRWFPGYFFRRRHHRRRFQQRPPPQVIHHHHTAAPPPPPPPPPTAAP